MYKWSVKITTKSGAVLNGVAECNNTDAKTVAEEILNTNGKIGNVFNGMFTADEKGLLFYSVLEVAAFEVCQHKGE